MKSKSFAIVVLALVSSQSVLAATPQQKCVETYAIVEALAEKLKADYASVEPAEYLGQTKAATILCMAYYKSTGDTDTVKMIKYGTRHCVGRNLQNSPTAEAVCRTKLLAVPLEGDRYF